MGGAGLPLYVSETRSLYRYRLNLLPAEDGGRFDLIQDRGGGRKVWEGCAVTAFELRIVRGETVHLKLDIRGERPPEAYPSTDPLETERGERFTGDYVTYRINGREYSNIYGLTVSVKKGGGAETEVWIKRVLEAGTDLPDVIEKLTVAAELVWDCYEYRRSGMFRLHLSRLVLSADETAVDCADAVIGPLRYYCAGTVNAEVFTSTGETLE
jgi:hypothetical protein